MLHTIQVDDVIPILPPAVGWVAAATLVVMFPKKNMSVNCVSCSVALCLKGVSQLSIDHFVWQVYTLWVLISGNYKSVLENISEVLCSSRRQYRDYIIDLYGVKHCTVSNSMPSLSCLLSFYTIPISIIL